MRLRKDKSTRLEFQPASAVAPRWLSASTRWLVARVIWSRKPSTAAAAANTRNGLDTTRWRREHAAIDHRSIRTGCVGADANGLQMHQQTLGDTRGHWRRCFVWSSSTRGYRTAQEDTSEHEMHWSHNPKVAGSNPAPATTGKPRPRLGFLLSRCYSSHPHSGS